MSSNDRISQIPTLWTVVRQAHGQDSAPARSAQQQMIDRYGGAIQRYLLAALRDSAAADDAYQEFAVRFLNGDYRSADPERGRFRSFLKTILYRLVVEHHRGQKRRRTQRAKGDFPDLAAPDTTENDQNFQQTWCDELLHRAWAALQAEETSTGRPLFSVMRAKVDNPDATSTELAAQVSGKLEKPVSVSNLRVMLHRSRETFAKLLLEEVADTIDEPTRNDVEEELIELGLLEYCRPALEALQ